MLVTLHLAKKLKGAFSTLLGLPQNSILSTKFFFYSCLIASKNGLKELTKVFCNVSPDIHENKFRCFLSLILGV